MRQKILNSARKLFIEKGYNKTTLNDIVKGANTSIGNYYFYYKSKENVLLEIILSNIEVLDEIVQKVVDEHNISNLIKRVSVMIYVYSYELLNNKEIVDLHIMGSSFPGIRKNISLKIKDIFNRHKNHKDEEVFNEEFLNYIDILPILYKSIIIDLCESYHLGDFDRSKEEMLEFMVRWILKSFGIKTSLINKNLEFLSSINIFGK